MTTPRRITLAFLVVIAAAVLTVAVPALVVAAPKPPYRIPIFVRSAADSDGFTDPSKDRRDSLKDLVKQLRDSDVVAPVDMEAEAVAVLEVLGRSTRSERNGWTAVNGQRQNKSVLTVRLTAGEYSTEFTGESKSKGVLTGYGQAAEKVVKQLEDWVTANRERLMAGDVR
jgi:hypothetical protein